MLEEAVAVMRELWAGQQVSREGDWYTVQTARLYSVPVPPPPVYVSGFGPKAARLAGRIGDGYLSVQPDGDLVRLFRESGGGDRPAQGGLKVCWAPDAASARKTMHRLWPTDVIPGESTQLLPSPRHFAQLAELVTEEMITAPCGPDPAVHLAGIRAYLDAGFDEVYVGQVGPDADGFFEFYAAEILPRLRDEAGG